MLLLNLPDSVTAAEPWTEDHVFVIMAGAWDAAAARSTQG
jgi:hypothetical protein